MDGNSPIGWLCVAPPILTIVLAILSRRVVLSLILGICLAVFLLLPTPKAFEASHDQPFSWLSYLSICSMDFVHGVVIGHLWKSLSDGDHLLVFAFTTVLGAQVALIHRCGGMLGIVEWAKPLARTRRGGQILTWLLGLLIFIDDYANTLLLGSTMSPITDRLKISREKLAYLVDSTAAPVSGLALVSTWVATEISSMQDGYQKAGIEIGTSTISIFLETIPSRFYILYTLAFVFLCGLLCRDFGPMLRAEQNAADEEPPATSESSRASGRVPRAINAILPIGLTVVVVVALLVVTGLVDVGDQPLPESTWQRWGAIVGAGSSYISLFYGALAGLLAIIALIAIQRCLEVSEVAKASLDGVLHVVPALVILWLAWALSGLTGEGYMQTGQFLAAQISQLNVSPALMPTIIFVLASAIAFSTGTSWGTMLILMPLTIPLVYGLLSAQLSAPPAPDHFVLVASVGSVLAGAIFGDHCSPISDTTILSSRSSGCNHIAHVRTQMPYALTVAGVAIVFGTLPAGFGINSWLLLPLGTAAMVVILLTFGRATQSKLSASS
ncbi:MAG: hypothetical protein KDB22_24455 [Planctomycetales bacterium]|nr:hypothetical protein [Planctomycetales bacterium]